LKERRDHEEKSIEISTHLKEKPLRKRISREGRKKEIGRKRKKTGGRELIRESKTRSRFTGVTEKAPRSESRGKGKCCRPAVMVVRPNEKGGREAERKGKAQEFGRGRLGTVDLRLTIRNSLVRGMAKESERELFKRAREQTEEKEFRVRNLLTFPILVLAAKLKQTKKNDEKSRTNRTQRFVITEKKEKSDILKEEKARKKKNPLRMTSEKGSEISRRNDLRRERGKASKKGQKGKKGAIGGKSKLEINRKGSFLSVTKATRT